MCCLAADGTCSACCTGRDDAAAVQRAQASFVSSQEAGRLNVCVLWALRLQCCQRFLQHCEPYTIAMARLCGVASLPYVAELHHLQEHTQLCACNARGEGEALITTTCAAVYRSACISSACAVQL
jgi:hypothetical protein